MASVTTTFAAKDSNFSQTVEKLQKSLGGFDASVNKFNERAASIGTSFAGLGLKLAAGVAAFVGVRSAAEGMGRAFEQAAQFQTFERRFETLLGTTEAAKARMIELEQFMDGTPFELPGIAQASQTLQALTGGALATGDGLRMVGDTASATGKPIEEMAVTLGRLYNGLTQGGVAIGDQNRRLVELGVITPQAAQELAELAKEGVGSARAFELISEATSQFSGEMQRQSTTWTATLEGLNDAINTALRAFATPLIEELTPQIQGLADFVRGTLAPAISGAMEQFTTEWLPKFKQIAQNASDFLRGVFATAPMELFKQFVLTMQDVRLIVGDQLVSAFVTAVTLFGNLIKEMFANDVPRLIGEYIGTAFMQAVVTLQHGLVVAIDETVKLFARLWDSASQMTSKQLLSKLMDVVQFFATGFGRAMIDPVGFLAQNVAEGLKKSFADTAHEFNFQYDKATGTWLNQIRVGLANTAEAGGKKLEEAGEALGGAIARSTQIAIDNTEAVKLNLFGGDEAAQRIAERTAAMVEHGKQFRTEIEFAADAIAQAMSDARLDRFAAPSGEDGMMGVNRKDRKFPWQGSGPSGSQEPTTTDAPSSGGGGTRGGGTPNPRQQSTIEMLRERAAAGDLDAMTELGRMQNENSRFMDRANRLRDSGNFRSAAQAELAGNRASERRADNAAMRDRLQQEFGTKDSGTALREFRDNFGMDSSRLISEGLEKLGLKFDKGQSEQKNFERLAKAQAKMGENLTKTESERKGEEKSASGAGSSSSSSSALALEATLQACRDFLKAIDEKLPQNSLS